MKKITLFLLSTFFYLSAHSQECDYSGTISCKNNNTGYWCIKGTTLTITGEGMLSALFSDFPYVLNPRPTNIEAINKIVISEGITGIDFPAIKDFKGISSIVLPSTLTFIGERSFGAEFDRNGPQVTELTIPEKVTVIESQAFRYLPLSRVTFLGSEPPEFPYNDVYGIPVEEHPYYNAFHGITAEVYVPKGSLEKYKEALKYSHLTFKDPYVKGIQYTVDSIQGKAGETFQLEYRIIPEDAENRNVTFVSSDLSVAVVDKTGLVYFIKSGKATITVITEEDSFFDEVSITVPKSADKNLSSLSLWRAYYSPAFDPDTTTYYTTVSSDVKRLDVVAQPSSKFSTLSIENNEALAIGENTVRIKVTAENGDVKIYKMIVYRMSDESSLESLSVTDKPIKLTPNKYSYDVYITSQDHIRVDYTTTGDKSKSRVEFSQDSTLIKIIVTAEDDRVNSTYEVKVKYLSNDAQLQGLRVESHDGLDNYKILPLTPSFNPEILNYEIKITPDIRFLYVDPTSIFNSIITGDLGFQFYIKTPSLLKLEVLSESKLATNTYFIKVSNSNSTGLDKVQTESGSYKLLHNGGLYKIYLDSNNNKVLKQGSKVLK
jgi:hypothetical protein